MYFNIIFYRYQCYGTLELILGSRDQFNINWRKFGGILEYCVKSKKNDKIGVVA